MFGDGLVIAMKPAEVPAQEHVGAIVVGIDLDALPHLAQSEIILPGMMLGHAKIEIDAGGERLDFASPLD